ncbi:hypothetical protein BJF85_10710 [Saccharomonospora sp. CUA-673]|uniref:hypothetical protein n=1 Tax=Saccharomonospora sp. CUA-673 TaxID=1904969 RepID=UPI00095EB9F0|nr:hypothetical protein [Saccharomonospora sp. CUA-673]OLT48935.1 hypothetical protein BJF85_10710 [Saccharomonospora sp. CUA-673]
MSSATTPATQRVYLHIGLPKTGTTSLQELLWHNREVLTADGVAFPGHDLGAHHRAVADVHPGRYGGWKEKRTPGSWAWLVEQAKAHQGTTLISSELLAPASPQEARQVVDAFPFAEVHIVCTVRDLARQIPSVWQENVKTRQSTSYPALLASLRAPELDDTARLFWDYQEVPRVLETWGARCRPSRSMSSPCRHAADVRTCSGSGSRGCWASTRRSTRPTSRTTATSRSATPRPSSCAA